MCEAETVWIHQHIKNIVSVEVAREWQLSRILCVQTTNGSVFFKSSTHFPLSADETRLTEFLTHLYPNDLPNLLAVDLERGWMIMGDVGATLQNLTPFELWQRMLMRLAEIQHVSIAHLDQLQAAGCPNRRQSFLEAHIDAMLADEAMLSGLEADEIIHLCALAPLLHDHCRQLSLLTLTHGDVHGAYVGYKDDQLRFFDWSESCIAHPFYDLPVILRDAAARFPMEQVDQLRDDYLACWQDGQRQWQIVRPIAALHHAMMYNGVAEVVIPGQPRTRVAGWLRDILSDFLQP